MADKIIPLNIPCIKGNEWKYVKDCLDTGWVSSVGKYVDKFEEKFSGYVGSSHAVSTMNGTSAIHTALLALGVEKDDLVLVPTLTFIASANPILYCNAIPVFVDSEEKTWNMDTGKVVEVVEDLVKRGKKPKAIVMVHLYGHPADMDPIMEAARKYEIYVIEDAAEALGSKYKGRMVGTLGDIGCFSFNGNKLITTGGGGMLVTDNKKLAAKAKYLTTQARDDEIEYIHKEVGYNYRMTNIQAAMGVAQLEQIDEFIQKKRRIAAAYRKLLKGVPGITTCREQAWAFCSFWMFSILVDERIYGMNKGRLLAEFTQSQIHARPFFTPLHTLPPFRDYPADNISAAHRLYEQGINLPCSVGITSSQIGQVVQVLTEKRKLT